MPRNTKKTVNRKKKPVRVAKKTTKKTASKTSKKMAKKPIALKKKRSKKLSPPRIEKVNSDKLFLDSHNPRFGRHAPGESEDVILHAIAKMFRPEDIAESILEVGYQDIDPLIVVEEGSGFIVIEGNRRLSAIKLLLDPSRAPEKLQPRWKKLSDNLTSEIRDSLKQFAVHVYPNRNDKRVGAYIGFRHVSGVLKWGAEQKAGFIAEQFKNGTSFEDLADVLGHTTSTITRHYVAFMVVQKAYDFELDAAESIRYGVLFRCLGSPLIREFIGLEFPPNKAKIDQPIPENKLTEFQEFLEWTFGGGESRPRLLADSRQVTSWAIILSSEKSIRYLRQTKHPKFDRAEQLAGQDLSALTELLDQAVFALEGTLPLVFDHAKNESVQYLVDRAAKLANRLLKDCHATIDESAEAIEEA